MKKICVEGYEFKTNDGSLATIIKSLGSGKFIIRFLDSFKYEKEVSNSSILRGAVRNPYAITVIGIGILGDVKRPSKQKAYSVWVGMLRRCYCDKDEKYKDYGKKGVKVSEEWLIFENFKKWYDKNYFKGCSLDKDILQSGVENKIYSKETCILVSSSENSKEVASRNSKTYFKKGCDNVSYKNLDYYETNAVRRDVFKNKCRLEGLEFSSFEEIFVYYEYMKSGKKRGFYIYLRRD